jgi:hypothetical protein
MDKVRLILSSGNRPLTVTLAHSEYCTALGSCACHLLPREFTRKNNEGKPVVHRKVEPRPSALHLIPGVETADLPKAILRVSRIASLVKTGDVKWTDVGTDNKPVKSSPAPRRRRRE